jgi:hypothetical protein
MRATMIGSVRCYHTPPRRLRLLPAHVRAAAARSVHVIFLFGSAPVLAALWC